MRSLQKIWRVFGGLGLLAVCAGRLAAEPVTFRFEARITGIDDASGGQIELPFGLSIGDEIRGLIEFEPVAFGQDTITNRLSLDVHGSSIDGTKGSLFSLDNNEPSNHAPWIDTIFSASDFETMSTTIPGAVVRGLSLRLRSGTGHLLSPSDGLGDAEAWNRVQPPVPPAVGIAAEREISFALEASQLPAVGRYTVTAQFGTVVLVPEPTAIKLFGVAFIVVCGAFSVRRAQRELLLLPEATPS